MAPIHPVSELPSAPQPPAGAYYSVKDQEGMRGPRSYRNRKRGPCCCCVIWLCSLLAILILLLGVAVLAFWLTVHPKVPKYDVQNVHIDGLSRADFVDGSLTVSPNTTFDLKADNRNKHIGIYYDEIHVMVFANGETIGDGYLPAFYQGHRNITYIHGDIGYSGATLSQLEATITDITNGQAVPLDVNVDVKVRLKVGSWKSRKITVKVRCGMQLDVSSSDGLQSVNDQHCKVKVKL